MHKYDDLKPKQQGYIQKFHNGLVNEAQELEETFEVCDAYTRSYIRYMSSKYCDMEWGPAWIVKDKSRVATDGRIGVYLIPELQEYADLQLAENHDQAVRDFEEERALDQVTMS